MGKKSRDKGLRGEREFAEFIGGKRVPLSGAMNDYPNDVILPNGWGAEVKRRKTGLDTVYKWVEDERERPDLVAFRADNKQWLVMMTGEKLRELLGVKRNE